MARIRRESVPLHEGVPAPLADPAAREWHDSVLFFDLVEALGLDLTEDPSAPTPAAAPCGKRRAAAVTAWATKHGLTSTTWPGLPDHSRLAAVGITNVRNFPACPHSTRQRPSRRRSATTPKELNP